MALTLINRLSLKVKKLTISRIFYVGIRSFIYYTNYNNFLFKVNKKDGNSKLSYTTDGFVKDILITQYLSKNNIFCSHAIGVYDAIRVPDYLDRIGGNFKNENLKGLLLEHIDGTSLAIIKATDNTLYKKLIPKKEDLIRKSLSLPGILNIKSFDDDFIYDEKIDVLYIVDFDGWQIDRKVVEENL